VGQRLNLCTVLNSQKFINVLSDTISDYQTTSTDLDRLKLAAHDEFVRRRPTNAQQPAASSTVTSIGYPNCDIEQLSESMGNFILLLSEERYLRPLYKEPLENGLFEQIR